MLDGDEPNPTPNPKTSQHLLDAAERLFYERGVPAVEVDAVVAEAGVSTTTALSPMDVEPLTARRGRQWVGKVCRRAG
jgi:hypothetical protein